LIKICISGHATAAGPSSSMAGPGGLRPASRQSCVPGRQGPVETLALWARRRRQRDALLSLDDYLLKDIGLTRLDAEAEWRKPFWRA
jgi:uncharacterized protein YjiS (DUF1127 family)